MSAPVEVGAVIAERYRVEALLGEGGMGVVMRATHLLLRQQVAIKFVRRDAVDDKAVHRVLAEAQSAASVQSEHVVRIHDVAALEDGTPYIVMEYLEGEDLASILTRGPLPVRDALRFAMQTCEALAVSHAAGVIHGDLKPENLYIIRGADGVGKVKLLDFGIAKGIDAERQTRPDFLAVASSGQSNLMGTPAYMAPEQFRLAPIDLRIDLWALGALLYEMLTGASPFPGDTAEQVAHKVLESTPQPIARPEVDPELEEIVLRCLAKEPGLRYASAFDVACALEPFVPVATSSQRLAAISTRNPATTTSQRLVPTVVVSRQTSHKGGWLLAIAIAVVFAGVVFVVGAKALRRASPAGASTEKHTEALPPPAPFADHDPVTTGAIAAPPHTGSGPIDSPPAPAAKPKPAKRVPPAVPRAAAAAAGEDDRFGTRK